MTQATKEYTSAVSENWTLPSTCIDGTSVVAECVGGGGAGGGGGNTGYGGSGGGGGAYSIKTYTVGSTITAGNAYAVVVGAAGSVPGNDQDGGAGGDTSFVSGSSCMAKGGSGGKKAAASAPTGGLGGAKADGAGDTKYQGATGASGGTNGGGNGGVAAANNGDSTATGSGTNPTGPGGPGGNGSTSGNGGAPASGYGGGGGGGNDAVGYSGGAGYCGYLLITYQVKTALTPSNDNVVTTGTPAATLNVIVKKTLSPNADAVTAGATAPEVRTYFRFSGTTAVTAGANAAELTIVGAVTKRYMEGQCDVLTTGTQTAALTRLVWMQPATDNVVTTGTQTAALLRKVILQASPDSVLTTGTAVANLIRRTFLLALACDVTTGAGTPELDVSELTTVQLSGTCVVTTGASAPQLEHKWSLACDACAVTTGVSESSLVLYRFLTPNASDITAGAPPPYLYRSKAALAPLACEVTTSSSATLGKIGSVALDPEACAVAFAISDLEVRNYYRLTGTCAVTAGASAAVLATSTTQELTGTCAVTSGATATLSLKYSFTPLACDVSSGASAAELTVTAEGKVSLTTVDCMVNFGASGTLRKVGQLFPAACAVSAGANEPEVRNYYRLTGTVTVGSEANFAILAGGGTQKRYLQTNPISVVTGAAGYIGSQAKKLLSALPCAVNSGMWQTSLYHLGHKWLDPRRSNVVAGQEATSVRNYYRIRGTCAVTSGGSATLGKQTDTGIIYVYAQKTAVTTGSTGTLGKVEQETVIVYAPKIAVVAGASGQVTKAKLLIPVACAVITGGSGTLVRKVALEGECNVDANVEEARLTQYGLLPLVADECPVMTDTSVADLDIYQTIVHKTIRFAPCNVVTDAGTAALGFRMNPAVVTVTTDATGDLHRHAFMYPLFDHVVCGASGGVQMKYRLVPARIDVVATAASINLAHIVSMTLDACAVSTSVEGFFRRLAHGPRGELRRTALGGVSDGFAPVKRGGLGSTNDQTIHVRRASVGATSE